MCVTASAVSSPRRPGVCHDVLQVQLAISHGLAQSTKLSIYEERLSDIVDATKHLPEGLARDGHVDIGRKDIARLIGEVRSGCGPTVHWCEI